MFFLLLKYMHKQLFHHLTLEDYFVESVFLNRVVTITCYMPMDSSNLSDMSLLLVNDGQDLVTMGFEKIIDKLYRHQQISPLLVVGIHCSGDRKNEYATANVLDYAGRGNKAALYTRFVMEELLPFISNIYTGIIVKEKSYAGFSLGGLSALDIMWSNPQEFVKVGVFSGSFWWRDKAQEDPDFNEDTDRIMHRLIREGTYHNWLKFFFEVGTQDETADRNNNGIIDAIDDTISLIAELKLKGFTNNDIEYMELKDGKHNVPTWARAFPDFLKWGWGTTAAVEH